MKKKPSHKTRDRRTRPPRHTTPGAYRGRNPAPYVGNNKCPCLSCNGGSFEGVRRRQVRKPETRGERRRWLRFLARRGSKV